MTRIIDRQSKRRSATGLTVGIILTAALAFGTFAGSASAEDRGRDHRDYHHRDWNGGYYRDRDWNGGYYRAPPVVYGYGSPYYAPPVVYGPGIGLNFNFR